MCDDIGKIKRIQMRGERRAENGHGRRGMRHCCCDRSVTYGCEKSLYLLVAHSDRRAIIKCNDDDDVYRVGVGVSIAENMYARGALF